MPVLLGIITHNYPQYIYDLPPVSIKIMKILYDPHSSCRNLVNDYFKELGLALRNEVLNGYRFINGGERNSNWV
jgi:hypothetical protein|tara:strand:+ start:283 stop:504 length:222 start_codon:yes stop_codon:yes gene_type:complete